MIFRALFVSLAAFALAYSAIASCLCAYLGAGTHRWCPMCRVLEIFCRRIAR